MYCISYKTKINYFCYQSSIYAFEIKPDNENSYFYAGTIPERLLNNTKYVDAIQDDYWVLLNFSIFLFIYKI